MIHQNNDHNRHQSRLRSKYSVYLWEIGKGKDAVYWTHCWCMKTLSVQSIFKQEFALHILACEYTIKNFIPIDYLYLLRKYSISCYDVIYIMSNFYRNSCFHLSLKNIERKWWHSVYQFQTMFLFDLQIMVSSALEAIWKCINNMLASSRF